MSAASDFKWFHALKFPDGSQTPGRFDAGRPPNYTLYGVLSLLPHLDLARAECLDIGTMDGLAAWALAAAGAGRVTATDIAPRASFAHARQRFGHDVDYRVPFVVADLPRGGAPAYDLIVYSGVLYHVFDPLPSLVRLRMNIRLGGYVIVETHYLADEPRSRLSFSPSDGRHASQHPNTFFRPSFRALRGMIETAGFEVVASIGVRSRLTVLARAEQPSRIRTASPVVRKVLDQYRNYENYREDVDYPAMEAISAPAAITYSGPRGDYVLHASRYRPTTPAQPEWSAARPTRLRVALGDRLSHLRTSLARRQWLPHWPLG